MCQSKANGGQRCYSHTSARLDTATRDLHAAHNLREQRLDSEGRVGWARHPEWEDEYRAAEQDYRDARIEVASTRRGERELRTQAATYTDGDPRQAALLEDINRGVMLRERNAAIRAANSSAPHTSHPHAATGRRPERNVNPDGHEPNVDAAAWTKDDIAGYLHGYSESYVSFAVSSGRAADADAARQLLEHDPDYRQIQALLNDAAHTPATPVAS